MRFRNVSSSLLLSIGAAALVGCATHSPDVPVPAAEYADAFTAARDVLHSYRFTLDRVDARAGVLTTHPSQSAGFFTPWSRNESTLGQEWEDTIHDQQRRVEIVFSPAIAESTGPDLRTDQAREHASDLLEQPRDTTARVAVFIERIYQFGWRPNTKSTVLMSLTEDTQPGAPSRVVVDISEDPALAGRIASEIQSLLAKRAGRREPSPVEPVPDVQQPPVQTPAPPPPTNGESPAMQTVSP
ncbi:MAG: hypothetical protein J0L78_04180 [Planctomycetes bacterium]|nr:hypothetical protein [Planctomycetota bacterium]